MKKNISDTEELKEVVSNGVIELEKCKENKELFSNKSQSLKSELINKTTLSEENVDDLINIGLEIIRSKRNVNELKKETKNLQKQNEFFDERFKSKFINNMWEVAEKVSKVKLEFVEIKKKLDKQVISSNDFLKASLLINDDGESVDKNKFKNEIDSFLDRGGSEIIF